MKNTWKWILSGGLISIVIVISMVIQPKFQEGFFQLNRGTPVIPNVVSSLKNSNDAILRSLTLYQQKKTSISPLENTLKQRKGQFIKLMKENPIEANKLSLARNAKSFPASLQKYIETEKTLEGTVEIEHSDDFQNLRSQDFYFIRQNNGDSHQVYFSMMPQPEPNSIVRVRGVFLDGVGISAIRENFLTLRAGIIPPDQNIRMLVIPISMPSPTIVELTNENIRSSLFDIRNSVRSFYEKNSYGRIRISGDVDETLTTPDTFRYEPSEEQLEVLVTRIDPYVDFRRYDHYLFVGLTSYCSGRGSIGKRLFKTAEGGRMMNVAYVRAGCFEDEEHKHWVTHEIGHNLTLNHAQGWTGYYGDIPFYSEQCGPLHYCGDIAYGDDSVMGNGPKDLSAYQRKILSSPLSPVNSLTVTRGGEYWLYPLDNALNSRNDEYEEIQIPTVHGYYSLDYRDPGEVIVRFVPLPEHWYFFPYTFRMGESTATIDSEVFGAEGSFTDNLRGIQIRLGQKQANRMGVYISLPRGF